MLWDRSRLRDRVMGDSAVAPPYTRFLRPLPPGHLLTWWLKI